MLIHPTGFTQPQRFTRFYFNNVIGNPLDTTVALHYLIFDGVFERHPKLRVLAVHGGGFLGAYSAASIMPGGHDRMRTVTAGATDDVSAAERLFRHRRLHPHQLEALVTTYGARSHRAWHGLPFDMLEYDPIGMLRGRKSRLRRPRCDLRRQREEIAGSLTHQQLTVWRYA